MERSLRIAVAGHINHGKSTLIGRLLHETGNLPADKLAEAERASSRRNSPLEWAYVMDVLQQERDQADPMTIDTSRAWLTWRDRRYEIIDAPGHREFVHNMITGASDADGALLVVDASEGAREQTRCHAHVLRLLGVNQLVLVLNKMDALDYAEKRFDDVAAACKAELAAMGLAPLATVPVCARAGENLVVRPPSMAWYHGPSLMEVLSMFHPQNRSIDEPFRLRVQDVYRLGDQDVAVGRIDSGVLAVGDQVALSPEGSRTAIRSIERWEAPKAILAQAGESIGVTFEEQVRVTRGDVIAHIETAPKLGNVFRTITFWLRQAPPVAGETFTAQFGATAASVAIVSMRNAIDTTSLAIVGAGEIPQYAIIELYLRSEALVPLDLHSELSGASRFVLTQAGELAACGFVDALTPSQPAQNLSPHAHLVSEEERTKRNGHRGAVIWMTGLPGSGKSTLAMAFERRLFRAGANVFAIDGDRIRMGLNSDLGFSARDRSENVRRVAEVAAMFAEAGAIVITALISPAEHDRAIARGAAGARFHEIFVDADLETCERRDPKGLYRRARAGEIAEFTGVSAPYERPFAPELALDTVRFNVDSCLELLTDYVERVTGLKEAEPVH